MLFAQVDVVPVAVPSVTTNLQLWALIAMLAYLLIKQAIDKGALTSLLDSLHGRQSAISMQQQANFTTLADRLGRLEQLAKDKSTPPIVQANQAPPGETTTWKSTSLVDILANTPGDKF
jgi:hypothetical protein